jgi:hypothetical protein
MALALAGRGAAGPLAGADSGIGTKETFAARTAASPHSGHRSPPGWRLTHYPTKRTPLTVDPKRCVEDYRGLLLFERENPEENFRR